MEGQHYPQRTWNEYGASSAYAEADPHPSSGLAKDVAPDWNDFAPAMRRDADTLAELLAPVTLPPYAPVHEQVFGAQRHQGRLTVQHLLNLFDERARLHQRHARDIESRHIHFQERLFGARLHGSLDNFRRADRFEQMLAQLDEQKRQEELGFWKDTMEIRESLFEAAKEYQALRERVRFLEGTEPGGPGYG